MQTRVRDAKAEDFDDLWRIDQQCFEPGISYTRRELSRYMNLRGAFTLVGETKAGSREAWKISAFAVGQQPRRGRGHIVTIDVLPDARRSGLGTRLMNAVEKNLQEAGCENIFLETAVDNVAALKFYKRLGYSVVKTIPRYYLDKIDALMMAKSARFGDAP